MNDSDLDSVTPKVYKVRAVDGIWGQTTAYDMPKKILVPVLRLAIEEVTKREKKNLVQKISGKNQNFKFAHFSILVSDLDSGSGTVSDLDKNSL